MWIERLWVGDWLPSWPTWSATSRIVPSCATNHRVTNVFFLSMCVQSLRCHHINCGDGAKTRWICRSCCIRLILQKLVTSGTTFSTPCSKCLLPNLVVPFFCSADFREECGGEKGRAFPGRYLGYLPDLLSGRGSLPRCHVILVPDISDQLAGAPFCPKKCGGAAGRYPVSDYFPGRYRGYLPDLFCIGCTPSKRLLSAFHNTRPLLRTLQRTSVSIETLTRRLLRTLLRSTSFKEPSKNPSKKRGVAWPPWCAPYCKRCEIPMSYVALSHSCKLLGWAQKPGSKSALQRFLSLPQRTLPY